MGSAYEVRLRGVVSGRVLDAFDTAMEVRVDTVLHGRLRDQAELHGLFARLNDLGLELIAVRQMQHDCTSGTCRR
jgi:hypothetical protein